MNTGTVFNVIAFNGTVLNAQPSSHKWVAKTEIGVDGSGRGIYPLYREYELKWDFLSTDEFQQIYNFFLSIGQTGTIVATLPQFNAADYQFYSYSGTILREPEIGDYFQNYISDVKMLIVRILT